MDSTVKTKSPVCPCCAELVPDEDFCKECDPRTQGWQVPCNKHEKSYWKYLGKQTKPSQPERT